MAQMSAALQAQVIDAVTARVDERLAQHTAAAIGPTNPDPPRSDTVDDRSNAAAVKALGVRPKLPEFQGRLGLRVRVRVRDSYTVYLSNTWKAEPESRVEQQSLRRSYYCRNTYRIVAISVETHIDPICVCGCMKTSKNIVYTKF